MLEKSVAHKYAVAATSGELVVCELVKLSCRRYLDDLVYAADRGLYFDEKSALRAIRFIEKLKHTKGEWAGQSFTLEPWQQFIVWNIFGWKRADGTRRYRNAYTEVSRKNGKTALSSGIGSYMLFADGEARAEVYSAATTRKQAEICFDEAVAAVRATTLRSRIKIFRNAMVHEVTGSKFAPLSSDYDTLDGLNPSCAIIDEFHAHKDSGIYDVIISGMGARLQPLVFIITTAGFNKNGPCYDHRRTCIGILRGILEDDSIFAFICTQDSEDEWTNPSMWVKSNPNLGVSLRLEYLEDRVLAAQNKPSEIVNVKTKNLNMWTDASDVWVVDDKFVACHDPDFDVSTLEGRECFGGLDLSNSCDITAFALIFEIDGRFVLLLHCWIPYDTMMERFRKENISYPDWVDKGYVIATDGNVIDRDFVHAEILRLANVYRIISIAYDRWGITDTAKFLTDNGITISNFGQGYASLSPPTKKFEELILQGNMEHLGNPVLRWMMSNVELRRDPAGNIKVDKGKSRQKIDGVMAAIMALGEWMTHNMSATLSIYEKRGLRDL